MIPASQLAQMLLDGYNGTPSTPDGYVLIDQILVSPGWLFWRKSEVGGFVWRNYLSGDYLVVLQGTQDALEWADNFDCHFYTIPELNAKVEHGFYRMFRTLVLETSRQTLQAFVANTSALTDVTITGHSLGGALACIAAALNPSPVTLKLFAPPRAGDALLTAACESRMKEGSFILRNSRDIVPNLPPWGTNVSIGSRVFDGWKIPSLGKDVGSQHRMPCYIAGCQLANLA